MNAHSTSRRDDSEPISKLARPLSAKNEKDFLAEQSEVAKKAVANSAKSTIKGLGALLDPRTWARRFPLPTTGLAAVAGFVAVVHPDGSPESHKETSEKEPTTSSAMSVFSVLIQAGVDILKSALVPVLSHQLAEKFQGTDKKEDEKFN